MFNQYTRFQIGIKIRVYKLHYAVLVIWISLLSLLHTCSEAGMYFISENPKFLKSAVRSSHRKKNNLLNNIPLQKLCGSSQC